MLSAVLRSPTAIQVSIKIMEAFVTMRRLLLSNAQLFQRLEDSRWIKTVLNALEHGIKSFANLPKDEILDIVRDSKRRKKL